MKKCNLPLKNTTKKKKKQKGKRKKKATCLVSEHQALPEAAEAAWFGDRGSDPGAARTAGAAASGKKEKELYV